MIAAITLKFLDPFGTGKLVLFQVTYDKVSLSLAVCCVMTYLFIGLACTRIVILRDPRGLWSEIHPKFLRHSEFISEILQGVYGAWFSKLNYRWSKEIRNKTWLKSHPVAEVVLVLQCLAHRSPEGGLTPRHRLPSSPPPLLS